MSTEPSNSVEKRNFKYEAEAVGTEVNTVSPGDRVAVNVETFCGECFFCKRGNRTDTNGGGTRMSHLSRIAEAYRIFESKGDGVIKVALTAGNS